MPTPETPAPPAVDEHPSDSAMTAAAEPFFIAKSSFAGSPAARGPGALRPAAAPHSGVAPAARIRALYFRRAGLHNQHAAVVVEHGRLTLTGTAATGPGREQFPSDAYEAGAQNGAAGLLLFANNGL